jgi:hypothetical protein
MLFTHTWCAFMQIFFWKTLWKILYTSEGFVTHSLGIKDLYQVYNRLSVTEWFITHWNIY